MDSAAEDIARRAQKRFPAPADAAAASPPAAGVLQTREPTGYTRPRSDRTSVPGRQRATENRRTDWSGDLHDEPNARRAFALEPRSFRGHGRIARRAVRLPCP